MQRAVLQVSLYDNILSPPYAHKPTGYEPGLVLIKRILNVDWFVYPYLQFRTLSWPWPTDLSELQALYKHFIHLPAGLANWPPNLCITSVEASAGITPVFQLQNDEYNCGPKQHAQIEREEELPNVRFMN